MNEKRIKVISKSKYVNAPDWLHITNDIDYITLSKETSIYDIDLFIFSLFVYNSIDFTTNSEDSFNNLLNSLEDGLVLGGGLMFCDEKVEIAPSCCCGLEDSIEVISEILDNKAPWLGHDPYPTLEFFNQKIVVWSDDCLGTYGIAKPKVDLQSIEFNYNEMQTLLLNAKNDFIEFFTIPLKNRISDLVKKNADDLFNSLLLCFNVTK